MERRLAAILAADVEGYSRLMGADEVGTLRDLTQRRSILDGFIAAYRGRIANTAGDSVLAEFSSAVDAVQCAVEAQAALAEANVDLSPDRHIKFRIGIHVGDVMIKGGDLFGDSVNIAARLQTLASAGGIFISGVAHDQVRKILPFAFTDLGAQQVKNIEEPVRAFAVMATGAVAGAMSANISMPLALPDKPSIAVLPFQNMSGDPEQEYFADGMVEDITTALSRFKWLLVIARNSSFTYKGRAVDIKEVGRELGVRYVLEGSIRRAGDRVRITGQLIEASSGRHIWAEKYDGDLTSIFELQDEITSRVVAAIEPNLKAVEIERARAKPTESLDAYDLYLRALPEFHSSTEKGFCNAERFLRRSIARDPNFGDALAALSDCIGRLTINYWREFDEGGKQARHFALRAVDADPDNGTSLAIAAWCLSVLIGQHDQAIEFASRAIRLLPNSSYVRTQCGWVYVFGGDFDTALMNFEMARRLNPIDPRSVTMFAGTAAAYFYKRDFGAAVYWGKRSYEKAPAAGVGLRYLAAALVQTGQMEEAKTLIAHLKIVAPTASLSRARRVPLRYPWMADLFFESLAVAGLE